MTNLSPAARFFGIDLNFTYRRYRFRTFRVISLDCDDRFDEHAADRNNSTNIERSRETID